MSENKPGSELFLKQTVDGKALVKVLWTGGYDSTFRIAELSRYDIIIQPYYLSDRKRRSEAFEMHAISEITSVIERNPETRCRILPLEIHKVSEFKPDREIVEAYDRLRSVSYIGPQYVWLAQFAKSNPGLELCIEKLASESGATYCISRNGELRKINSGDLAYWVLDQENSNKDILTIFGSMHFPIIQISKMEMLDGYRIMGFSEILEKTWFCHTPVRGEPCGVCNPCRHAIQEGLGFKIPSAGLIRHEFEMKYRNLFWFKFWKKIRYRIYGY